jgi:glycosyltransferase involved in cell wall biosynthesis
VNAGGAGVLVSHPGRQHSHQAAMALHRAGRLAGYWAGIPSCEEQGGWIPAAMRRSLIPYSPTNLPVERTRWLPIAVALRRVSRPLPVTTAQVVDYLACRAFDKQVAHGLERAHIAAVMACEISARDTFRMAKRLGLKTILDAASVHYAVQDRVCRPLEPGWLHRRVVAVKQAEIELADHVLTVSELARAGYIEAGVPAARVHAVALGADTRLFTPRQGDPDRAKQCTFVFAGATIYRKGIDVLLEAFRTVERAARLVVIGPRGECHGLVERAAGRSVVVHPAVPQGELLEIFRSADCFVLPSRHDSFGMAVIEAMACGVPAIVSEMVGAREAIEEGGNGWVVPVADAAALAARMQWCVASRPRLAAMRPHARAAAERYSWERYGARLTGVTGAILGAAA